MANQLCIVLDFGGQYNQLIARRVRDCGVYCEIRSYTTPLEEIKTLNPMGIIFTGGPNSVYEEISPLQYGKTLPILQRRYLTLESRFLAYATDVRLLRTPWAVK